jgi:hypothetical protein
MTSCAKLYETNLKVAKVTHPVIMPIYIRKKNDRVKQQHNNLIFATQSVVL